jgi:hypothetical protein
MHIHVTTGDSAHLYSTDVNKQFSFILLLSDPTDNKTKIIICFEYTHDESSAPSYRINR